MAYLAYGIVKENQYHLAILIFRELLDALGFLAIKQELSRESYHFDGVRYMDLLADGTFIAADKNNHQIKFISPNGSMPLILGNGHPGHGPEKFTTPRC
ncbi:MAG: hypothetical protein DBP02_06170 [gamma proteobacterium symbiont of Ctena orbiculata]|nr:MAG: hypothetical protein DBP02_06170 [gamma proteobacterium symbiont of Ctena orbiculata]